jgi:hypothetical protein
VSAKVGWIWGGGGFESTVYVCKGGYRPGTDWALGRFDEMFSMNNLPLLIHRLSQTLNTVQFASYYAFRIMNLYKNTLNAHFLNLKVRN